MNRSFRAWVALLAILGLALSIPQVSASAGPADHPWDVVKVRNSAQYNGEEREPNTWYHFFEVTYRNGHVVSMELGPFTVYHPDGPQMYMY